MLVPVNAEGVPATFLLDTGATNTVLSTDFAGRVGLTRQAKALPVPVETAAQPLATAQYAPLGSFKLGPIRVRENSGEVMILDLSNASVLAGEQIDGFVGNDLLGSADFILNVSKPSLRVARTLDLSSNPGAGSATISGYKTYLPVTINGRSFAFLLDTGSSRSFVSPELFQALGKIQSDTVQLGSITVNAAESKSVRRFRAAVTLGEISVSDFTFLVQDKNVIGIDLLRLGELSVSVKQRRFAFRKANESRE